MALSLNQSPLPSVKAVPTAKRLSLVLMGGAGLILLGGGGALVGLNSHLTSLQTTAQQKQSEVGSSEDITKRYETTQAAYTETQSRMQYLEASVSAKSYVPTLLGQLQTLAAQTHLTVTSVRPSAVAPTAPAPAKPASGDSAGGDLKKAPPPPPYDTLNIDVNVTGTYADTATFLYDLTKFPKIVSLAGAQMHPNGLPPGASPYASPTVTTDLKLVAFMFHDDDAAPAQPGAALTQAALPSGGIPGATMPQDAVGKLSPAAGHVAASAVGATKAMNARAAVGVGTL